VIVLNNVIVRRGTKVLFDHASATIHAGEKVGLVGRNGAGKSTLFALLDGGLHEDQGDVTIPAGWRLAEVAQEMPGSDEPATDFVLAGDTVLAHLQTRLQQAESAGDGMAMAQVHAELADAGAYDARPRAEALILGLGFQPDALQNPVNSFSGGWRMRLQLARALMAPSDLLLLDEPTNHLDLDALIWLEGWLARYSGTLITISHDREFLDAVTRTTLHIEGQQLKRYGGNYSAFETLRAAQLSNQQAAYAKQQEQIAHLQKFITRFKAKATKARQAQSRVKALERMEKIAPVLADAEFQFEFRPPADLPDPMLVMRDGVFGYAANAADGDSDPDVDGAAPVHAAGSTAIGAAAPHVILSGVTRTVRAHQRIGILGANGQGKSTWVKTVAGVLPLLSGKVTRGKGLAVGYFAQRELDVLQPQDSALEHFIHLARTTGQANTEAAREQSLRNFLGNFNFAGDMVKQPVGQFSGGETARLALALIVWQRPNLLLLDEPTNHLDLATREALAMALNEFDGTLILVSHDRALLRAVCDEFWLVADGGVRNFDGDLEDYRRYLLEQARYAVARVDTKVREAAAPAQPRHSIPSATPAQAPAEASRSPQNRATERRQQAEERQRLADKARPIKRALAEAEKSLQHANGEKTALEQRLLEPLAPSDLADAGRAFKRVSEAIAELEERWLTLSEQLEKLESTVTS
jgi:ATP-binding cassette subfamily F protein 3